MLAAHVDRGVDPTWKRRAGVSPPFAGASFRPLRALAHKAPPRSALLLRSEARGRPPARPARGLSVWRLVVPKVRTRAQLGDLCGRLAAMFRELLVAGETAGAARRADVGEE